MFDNDNNQEMYDNEYRDRPGSGIGGVILGWFLKILSLIIGLPAVLIGTLHFTALFMKGRQRLSVIAPFTVIELLILFPIAIHSNFSEAFKNLVSGHFTGFIWSYVAWCAIIGIIGSFLLVCIKAFQFRTNPATLAMDGWLYNFKYRDTPWVKFKQKYLQSELADGKAYDAKGAPVGLLEQPISKRTKEIDDNKESLRTYEPQVVYRSYKDAVKQTIVTGQTGSGKSVALLSLVYNDILNGIPLCYVDFKKSGDVLYFLSKWAKEHNREFYYFTNGEGDENEFYGQQATYDPLSTGDQTSRADFILNLREWDASADVYKQRTQEILQGVLYALQEVPHEEAPEIDWDSGNLKQLISALDLKNMYNLVNYLSKQYSAGKLDTTEQLRVSNFMSNYKEMTDKGSSEGKALREQLSGIRTVCNKLIMSSYGKWLLEGSSSKHINLLNIARDENAPIVLFAFSAQEEPDFAKAMGQVIMSDLNRVSAAKTGMNDKNYFGVYVDEFQTLNPKFIADLLAKARSAGFFITIASQSLEQISAAATENPDAILQSILDVCGNYLFLKGAKQDSAERMSKIMGQTKHIIRHVSAKTNTSLFNLNIFNNRNALVQKAVEDDWVISPSEFQSLQDAGATGGKYSEAYFISTSVDPRTGKKENAAQKVRIIAQKDILVGPSDEFLEFIKEQTHNHLQSSKNASDRQPLKQVEVEEAPTADPFAALKSTHKIAPKVSDEEIDEEIDSEFETIEPEPKPKPKKEVNLPPVTLPNDMFEPEVKKTEEKKPEVNKVVGFDPQFDDIMADTPKESSDEPPAEMTTFERIQWEKKHKKKEKKKTDLTPRDEPELLSHNIEKIPKEKKPAKFTLPKL